MRSRWKPHYTPILLGLTLAAFLVRPPDSLFSGVVRLALFAVFIWFFGPLVDELESRSRQKNPKVYDFLDAFVASLAFGGFAWILGGMKADAFWIGVGVLAALLGGVAYGWAKRLMER